MLVALVSNRHRRDRSPRRKTRSAKRVFTARTGAAFQMSGGGPPPSPRHKPSPTSVLISGLALAAAAGPAAAGPAAAAGAGRRGSGKLRWRSLTGLQAVSVGVALLAFLHGRGGFDLVLAMTAGGRRHSGPRRAWNCCDRQRRRRHARLRPAAGGMTLSAACSRSLRQARCIPCSWCRRTAV